MPSYAESMLKQIDDRIDQAQVKPTKMGTVVSRETATARATVTLDGASGLAQPVKCFETVIVDIGDRVGLIKFEGDWIIVGNYTPRTLGDVLYGFQFTSTTDITSASFVDLPSGSTTTIRKYRDVTQLAIMIIWSGYTTVANTFFAIGAAILSDDGTVNVDQLLYERAFNGQFEHQDVMGGLTTNLNLPAGGYSITARMRRTSGTGALRMNDDNSVTIQVREVVV